MEENYRQAESAGKSRRLPLRVGKPTLRRDLSGAGGVPRWFVTRLNTNGNPAYAGFMPELYEASLTAYRSRFISGQSEIHDSLSAGKAALPENHRRYPERNKRRLNVSVNTPPGRDNHDHGKTLVFLNGSVSGMSPAPD
ncbi:MAG: hypothetical protein ACLSAF_13915 [Intestinimonas sp.]